MHHSRPKMRYNIHDFEKKLLSVKKQSEEHFNEFYKNRLEKIKTVLLMTKHDYENLDSCYSSLSTAIEAGDYNACNEVLEKRQNYLINKLKSTFGEMEDLKESTKQLIESNTIDFKKEAVEYVMEKLNLNADFSQYKDSFYKMSE